MSLLLVVRSSGVHGTPLDGVVADDQQLEGGLRVFRRDGREVLRAAPEDVVVVRDLAGIGLAVSAASGSSIALGDQPGERDSGGANDVPAHGTQRRCCWRGHDGP